MFRRRLSPGANFRSCFVSIFFSHGRGVPGGFEAAQVCLDDAARAGLKSSPTSMFDDLLWPSTERAWSISGLQAQLLSARATYDRQEALKASEGWAYWPYGLVRCSCMDKNLSQPVYNLCINDINHKTIILSETPRVSAIRLVRASASQRLPSPPLSPRILVLFGWHLPRRSTPTSYPESRLISCPPTSRIQIDYHRQYR
jgi:hypothetical protein